MLLARARAEGIKENQRSVGLGAGASPCPCVHVFGRWAAGVLLTIERDISWQTLCLHDPGCVCVCGIWSASEEEDVPHVSPRESLAVQTSQPPLKRGHDFCAKFASALLAFMQ